MDKPYYVYILRCADDSLYIGIAADIEARMKAHCGLVKGGAKYTKSHPAKRLEVAWKTESKITAAKMEYALKRLKRCDKLKLISQPSLLCSMYAVDLSEYSYELCNRELLDRAMTINKED